MPCFHCHVVIKLPASHSAFMLGTKKTWPNKVKRRLGIRVETRAEANRRTAVRAGNARPDAWGKQRPQTVKDWQAWAFRSEQQQWIQKHSIACWSKHPIAARQIAMLYYYRDHEASKARSRVNARKTYNARKNDPEWMRKRTEQRRAWDNANKEYKKQRQREWWAAFRANRPEEYKERMRQMRKREASKPINRVISNVRKRLRDVMKGKRAALNVVGCTRKQLQEHLQSQFTKKMHWNNYGTYWHVDHIVPVSHFDLTNAEHVKLVHHYTNLRPMEAVANRLRGNKIDRPVQIHLPIV
jgi:hypothetical protein